MASPDNATLPAEMLNFVLRQGEFAKAGLRLGQLALQGRTAIPTPAFVASTSRGVIPHVTQDVMSKLTRIPAVYIGLEDFIEKTPQNAPVFKQPCDTPSKLRQFTCLPSDTLIILGPRRNPALACPKPNMKSAVAICTSVGFQSLQLDEYIQAAHDLGADVTLSLADIVTMEQTSQKRSEKSADRTHAWMRDTLKSRREAGIQHPLFASVPPLEPSQQSFYLSDLSDEYYNQLSGISLSSAETATALPDALASLPRMCLTDQETPHDIVRAVELGNDLIAVPFVTNTSENGTAMVFSFQPEPDVRDAPTGFDLWSESNSADLSPLVEGCQCYTCTRHHRAFLHHLLSAKEMLAWTLLQIHNIHTVAMFFEQIRESIADGTFEDKAARFGSAFSKQPPQANGQGPRVRGYQMKSVGGGEPKKNRKAYGRLDEQALKLDEARSGVATPEAEVDAADLERQGFGVAQV